MKSIRLRPETDLHDLEIKLNHAKQFIDKHHKVQFTVFFRGRQMLHKDRGFEILGQIAEYLEDVAKVEQAPKMMGKRMTMLVIPK